MPPGPHDVNQNPAMCRCLTGPLSGVRLLGKAKQNQFVRIRSVNASAPGFGHRATIVTVRVTIRAGGYCQ